MKKDKYSTVLQKRKLRYKEAEWLVQDYMGSILEHVIAFKAFFLSLTISPCYSNLLRPIHKLYIQAGSVLAQASLDSGTGLFAIQTVLKADTVFQDPVYYFTLLPL